MPRASLPLAIPLLLAACAVSPETVDPEVVDASARAVWSCSPRVELSGVWAFLSERYDGDHDARITRAEYLRGETRFANYDRDENGVLEPADFPPDTFFNGFNHMVVMRADADEDREVTRAEWRAFSQSLDGNGDGRMESEEVAAVLGRWASDWRLFLLSFDQDGNGEFDAADLELAFRDQDFDGNGVLAGKETQGWRPTVGRPDGDPPAVGELAPDFELLFAGERERAFRLSEHTDQQPIALVFGSYT